MISETTIAPDEDLIPSGCMFDPVDFQQKPVHIRHHHDSGTSAVVSPAKACQQIVSQSIDAINNAIATELDVGSCLSVTDAEEVFNAANAAKQANDQSCLDCMTKVLAGASLDLDMPLECILRERVFSPEELAFALGAYGGKLTSSITGIETFSILNDMATVTARWMLPEGPPPRIKPQTQSRMARHMSEVAVSLGLGLRPRQTSLVL